MNRLVTRMITATQIDKELKKLGSPEKIKMCLWFFKTGKGQYGYGDKFYGATVPEQRAVAKRNVELSFSEIGKLLDSKIHECRLTALLILVRQFEKGDESIRSRIVDFYLSHTARINNWDLVDCSAKYILGEYLLSKDREVLYKLAKSKSLWERRIAIISTHAFIAHGQYGDTIEISKMLLSDKEDLMHKAVGWMLREVGKKSKSTLVKFLEKYSQQMPRTALRYSIEHFSESERKRFMKR